MDSLPSYTKTVDEDDNARVPIGIKASVHRLIQFTRATTLVSALSLCIILFVCLHTGVWTLSVYAIVGLFFIISILRPQHDSLTPLDKYNALTENYKYLFMSTIGTKEREGAKYEWAVWLIQVSCIVIDLCICATPSAFDRIDLRKGCSAAVRGACLDDMHSTVFGRCLTADYDTAVSATIWSIMLLHSLVLGFMIVKRQEYYGDALKAYNQSVTVKPQVDVGKVKRDQESLAIRIVELERTVYKQG